MLRNDDRHLSPVRRHRRLLPLRGRPGRFPTICAAAGHGPGGWASSRSSGIRSTRQFRGAAADGWLKRQSGDPRKMDRDTSNRAKGGFATRAIHFGHRPADELGALPSPLMGTARIARRADFSFRKSGPGRTPQRLPCPDHQPAHSAEPCRRALSGRHRARWLLREKLFEKLYNHHYKTIHNDEARKRMSLDSVAHRTGIIPPGIWTGDERPAVRSRAAPLAARRSDRCQRRGSGLRDDRFGDHGGARASAFESALARHLGALRFQDC